LDFVVWSGMHECSCSTVLLIAFSSCPPPWAPPPAPPSLLPLSFNILLSVLLSPLSISRHKPKPLLAPHSPSQLIPLAPLYHNSQFSNPAPKPIPPPHLPFPSPIKLSTPYQAFSRRKEQYLVLMTLAGGGALHDGSGMAIIGI